MLEILHRRALAEKFRVIKNLQRAVAFQVGQQILDELLRAARQHRAANDQRVRLATHAERARDFRQHLPDETQVQRAGDRRGRADADDRKVRRRNRLLAARRGAQQSTGLCLRHQFRQARLDDRRHAAVERLDLLRMHVHAHDGVAAPCQAAGRDRADVAESKNADAQRLFHVHRHWVFPDLPRSASHKR